MTRAGRRRSVVWSCFLENAESGKRRVLCRFCQHDIVANPIRMVRHIVKHCPNADDQHKKICREYQTLTVPARRHTSEQLIDTKPQEAIHPPPTGLSASVNLPFHLGEQVLAAPLASTPLDQPVSTPRHSFLLPPDPSAVAHLYDELVLATVASGNSVRLLENTHFRRAMNLLHIQPLAMDAVKTHIVPRLRSRLEAEMRAIASSATTLTLQLSATLHGRGIGLEWFAADHDHRQVHLTSAKSSGHTELAASLIRDQLTSKSLQVAYICTDVYGDAKHIATTTIDSINDHTTEPSTRPVLVAGCMIQASLSLLAAVLERVPSLRRAVELCASVSECLVGDPDLLGQLRSHCSNHTIQLQTLQDDNLWSVVAVVSQVVQLKSALQRLLAESLDPIKQLVDDEVFWARATLANELLRPFGFLHALSDGGHLTSSLVLASWLLLLATCVFSPALAKDEQAAVTKAVLSHVRIHMDLSAWVCLLLDPRCRGLGLSPLGKRKVRTMAAEMAIRLDPQMKMAVLLEQLVKFVSHERPFDDEESWQMMAALPRLCWIEFQPETSELASLALAVLSFRPFIHSLQQTWATLRGAVTGSATQHQVVGAQDAFQATLDRLAIQSELHDKQTVDYRKQVLEAAASILFVDSPCSSSSSAISIPLPATACDGSAFAYVGTTNAAANQLWTVLAQVKTSFFQTESNPMAEQVSRGELSWFAMDKREIVAQLTACLHHALFGEIEIASLRNYSDSHLDAHGDQDAHLTMLSGIEASVARLI